MQDGEGGGGHRGQVKKTEGALKKGLICPI